jgi:hypothetical protein
VTRHACSLPDAATGARREWRVLRFGDATRQSVTLVTPEAEAEEAEQPATLRAAPGVLAFEYVRTMAVTALALWRLAAPEPRGLAPGARVLCLGGGGGSLPLFAAAALPNAIVDVVEIDPAVAAAMPHCGFAPAPPALSLHIADGAAFVEAAAREVAAGVRQPYDLALLDAFDGADDVPEKLAAPAFLNDLAAALHPARGAALWNMHGGLRPDAAQSALAAAAAPMIMPMLRCGGGTGGALARALEARVRGYDAGSAAGGRVAVGAEGLARALAAGGGGLNPLNPSSRATTAAFTLSVARQDNVVAVAARGLPRAARARAAALAAALRAAARDAARDAPLALPFDAAPRAVRGLAPVAGVGQAQGAREERASSGAALQ